MSLLEYLLKVVGSVSSRGQFFNSSCCAGSRRCDPKRGQRGEQKSAVGLDVAGNEFGLNSVTCRGTGISPASALTVTRHTSCAAGGGAGVDSALLVHDPVLVILALLVFLEGENTFVYADAVLVVKLRRRCLR